MIPFVDFIQLMFEPWLLESGINFSHQLPASQMKNMRTGIGCNISLRKVEIDGH